MGDIQNHRPPAVGIPAYFYPAPHDNQWSRLLAKTDGAVVVLNPANGPGAAQDPAYTRVSNNIRSGHGTVYGYVDTAYGTRSEAAILADARQFRAWYHNSGIFLDQTAPTDAHLDYYTSMVRELHADGFAVAMNPGQPEVDPRYLNLVEHVVLFEGPADVYQTAEFPAWVKTVPPERVWHLVYDVPDGQAMKHVLQLAKDRNAGMVFVTDGHMPNPWDTLPPYWEAERELTANS